MSEDVSAEVSPAMIAAGREALGKTMMSERALAAMFQAMWRQWVAERTVTPGLPALEK